MVNIIDKRVAEEGKGELGVVDDVYESDGEGEPAAFLADMDEKVRLNKSERGRKLKTQRRDFKDRVQKRAELREGAKDWVSNALADLVRTRDFIDDQGLGSIILPRVLQSWRA